MSFKYYNRNPDRVHTKDCVCRAISTVTGLYYDAVDNLLSMVAEDFECEELCVCCYNNLLEHVLCYPKIDCDYTKTVKEIAMEYPRNKVIVRVDAHLTAIVYGTVLDIWDCSDELVDCLWIVQ